MVGGVFWLAGNYAVVGGEGFVEIHHQSDPTKHRTISDAGSVTGVYAEDASEANQLYWADGTAGVIWRARPISTGVPEKVIVDEPGIRGLFWRSSALYWAREDGTLHMLVVP
jgi:hypothetical protein